MINVVKLLFDLRDALKDTFLHEGNVQSLDKTVLGNSKKLQGLLDEALSSIQVQVRIYVIYHI